MARRVVLPALAAAALTLGCGKSPTGPGGAGSATALAITGAVLDSDGTPIAGAWVSAVAGLKGSLQTPDAAGRFAMTIDPVTPGETVEFHASAPFHVLKVQRDVASGSTMVEAISLEKNPDLGIGASLQSSLSPTDPPRYVGEDYESDYLFNSTGFNYDTTSGPMVVELTYASVGNARLTMWAASGTLKSGSTDQNQSIVLPAGTKDTLLVGQPLDAGRLNAEVNFTLTTRPATSEDLPRRPGSAIHR